MQEVRRKARKQKRSWLTIEHDKAELSVKSKRTGGIGAGGKWEWALPDDGNDSDFSFLYDAVGMSR